MPRAFLVKKMCQASRWNPVGQDTENNSLSDSTGPYDLTLKLKKTENIEEAPPPALAMIGASYNQQYDFPLEPLSPNVPSALRSTIQRPYYPTYFANFGGQVTDVYYYPLPTPYTFQGQSSPTLTPLSSTSRDHLLPPPDSLRLGRCLDSNQKDINLYSTWTPETPSPSPESHRSIDRQEEGRYNCVTCDKSYSTYSGLSKHRQFHCTTHAKKSFNCKHCDKVYVSLGALKMHIRTHTLPCKCKLCGKAFSRPWLLQGHIRTHTGEKPFACSHCSRAFADRSNLRAHLQTHSDVKKYSCKACTKTFSRMSLLTKHEEGGGCLGTNQELRPS